MRTSSIYLTINLFVLGVCVFTLSTVKVILNLFFKMRVCFNCKIKQTLFISHYFPDIINEKQQMLRSITMSAVDLKEYTNRAKELEVAIYTQKQLMNRHREYLDSVKPEYPKRNSSIKKPVAPIKFEEEQLDNKFYPPIIAVVICILLNFFVY